MWGLVKGAFPLAGVAFCSLVAFAESLPPDATYRPLPTQPLEVVRAIDEADKPQVMKRQADLLAQRYDLSDRPMPGVMMSGGRKPVQDGVRVRLPADTTWDGLAAMSPGEIRAQGLLPEGFQPLPHVKQATGGQVFPDQQIDEIRRQEGRNLRRFDVDFDLPDHLRPEFPPPIFLTSHPELGDVSRGELLTIRNFYELMIGMITPVQMEGLRLLLTPFPQEEFNQTEDRKVAGAEPRRDLPRLPLELPHQRRLPSDPGRAPAGGPLPARHHQPARDVQPADPRLQAVAALGRGLHRVRAAHRLLQRRPRQRHPQGRAPARPGEPGRDDGADAEHHRLPAGAQARSVGASRSRAWRPSRSWPGSRCSWARASAPTCHIPQTAFMDNNMHDLKLERFYEIGQTVNDLVTLPDGAIKTFTLRGIKDSPPYLHDGRLMTLADTVEFFNLVLGLKLTQPEKDSLVAYMLAL